MVYVSLSTSTYRYLNQQPICMCCAVGFKKKLEPAKLVISCFQMFHSDQVPPYQYHCSSLCWLRVAELLHRCHTDIFAEFEGRSGLIAHLKDVFDYM